MFSKIDRISFKQYDYEQISLYCIGISIHLNVTIDGLRPGSKPGETTTNRGHQQIIPITTFTNPLTCDLSLWSMVVREQSRSQLNDYHLCQDH